MAEVFLARDTHTGRWVALKRLLGDDVEHLDLFCEEARLAGQLVDERIVQVLELGCDGDGLFIALEYIDGASLAAILGRARRGAKLALAIVLYLTAELAHALAYVHSAAGAIVHRDVKPSNVLVSRHGAVKLADFGIAKVCEAARRTRTGVVRGTAGYMAPEQVAGGAVSAAADVWSAGIVLWEALAGRTFEGVPGELAAPVAIQAVLDATLAHDPSLRPTAIELATRLDDQLDALGGRPAARDALATLVREWFADPPAPSPAEVPTKLDRPVLMRRSPPRWRGWFAGLAVLGSMVIGARWFIGSRDARPQAAIATVWREAQHGGHERARMLLDELDARDPEVATLAVLVHWWLGSRRTNAALDTAEALPLSAPRRALVGVIRLLETGRPAEAVAFARAAESRHPGTPEIAYALGEASWHAGDREDGSRWFARTIERDATWEMALHHAVDAWSIHGDGAAIHAAAVAIAPGDPSGAAALETTAAIAVRDYPLALRVARLGSQLPGADARIWQARAEAAILADDLDDAERSIAVARASWPVDDRDAGPFSLWAELRLYRGDEAGFSRIAPAGAAGDITRRIVWHGEHPPTDRPIRTDRQVRPPGDSGMAPPPLNELISVLGASLRGEDAGEFYRLSPYPEVRAFGAGLDAARRGDHTKAVAHFTRARDTALGETRMLAAYWLALTEHEGGDDVAARAACEDVRSPRRYATYRAVLLRACAAWIHDGT